MDAVERIKLICKERKLAISKMEKDLGFSNGYIAQLKRGQIRADRLIAIAEYLGESPNYLLTGVKEKPATETSDGPFSEKIAEINRLLPRLTEQELSDLLADVKATILGQ